MSRRLLVLTLVLSFSIAGCQEPPTQRSGGQLPASQAAYDVTYYDLAVAVQPSAKRLEGRLVVHAAVRDSLGRLVLDLDPRLSVTSAWAVGAGSRVTRPVQRVGDGRRIQIDLEQVRSPGDSVRVGVRYAGRPRVAPDPPWDGGVTWAETPAGAPWIATSNQLEGPDLWWPAKDHPSDEPDSMDISVTVPDSLVAASNGQLRGVQRSSDTTRTFRWHVSTPINAYTVALNVAPYVRLDTTYRSTSGQSVPVSLFVLPRDSSAAMAARPGFLDQLRFLEERLGPYPFRVDKYGVAETPFAGMEHQSIIAYGHDFTHGGLGYAAPFDVLHFHELAHEWYGNLVTVADWKDYWLHEGPATYLEALYAEHLEGTEAYHGVMTHYRDLLEGGRAIARRQPSTVGEMYHPDVYARGALTLHTLRYMVGKRTVRTILHRFVHPADSSSRSRFRHVTTSDFERLAEAVSGRSLGDFFDVYLYQETLPTLETTRTNGMLQLRWSGTGEASFEVPVPVAIGDTIRRVRMTDGRGRVPAAEGEKVRVDPNGWILRTK